MSEKPWVLAKRNKVLNKKKLKMMKRRQRIYLVWESLITSVKRLDSIKLPWFCKTKSKLFRLLAVKIKHFPGCSSG